jgi:hypothetical protein
VTVPFASGAAAAVTAGNAMSSANASKGRRKLDLLFMKYLLRLTGICFFIVTGGA